MWLGKRSQENQVIKKCNLITETIYYSYKITKAAFICSLFKSNLIFNIWCIFYAFKNNLIFFNTDFKGKKGFVRTVSWISGIRILLNSVWNDAAAKYVIQFEQIWEGWTTTINKLVANYHVIVRDTVIRTNTSCVQEVDDSIELIFFSSLHRTVLPGEK